MIRQLKNINMKNAKTLHQRALRNLDARKEFERRLKYARQFINSNPVFYQLIPEAKQDIERWERAIQRLRIEYSRILNEAVHLAVNQNKEKNN